ncbi:MAG: hypothetical protein BGO14_02040 [Chlamydiales bacterium 38-26]|nr:MAG: hypothetical protein BGO14_02040 [Chlamydiales bacterium 38-26]
MLKLNPYTAILTCIGLLLVIGWYYLSFQNPSAQILDAANTSYNKGVEASTFYSREQSFNKALELNAYLEQVFRPVYGNGRLYANLGQLYYNLEEYPLALFSYYQAAKLRPRDRDLAQAIDHTRRQLNLPDALPSSIFKDVFFFHTFLSLPERLQVVNVLSLLLFFLFSIHLWKPFRLFKGLNVFLIGVWMIFLGSLFYERYFEPLEGVMIQGSMLKRESNPQALLVNSQPIRAGTKVEVLDVLNEGQWLKVKLIDGNIGFVSSRYIRLIK